jgi:flavin-dependent dehydrogenase
VGEAAGFQDFLFGLGLRMALLSGWLAARSVLQRSDYDRAWQDLLAPRLRTSLVDRWLYEQGWIRRSLMARVEREDLRELLGSLERDHWGKRLLLPWVLRRRLRRSAEGDRIPRKKEARG